MRPTHPREEYLAPTGHIDFPRYINVLLDELSKEELAEVSRVISASFSGATAWAALTRQRADARGHPSEPRMEPAQNSRQDLKEYITGIVLARWHLLLDGIGQGMPLGMSAPPWAIRELNPLEHEGGAARGHRDPNHGTDPTSVFLRAGWITPWTPDALLISSTGCRTGTRPDPKGFTSASLTSSPSGGGRKGAARVSSLTRPARLSHAGEDTPTPSSISTLPQSPPPSSGTIGWGAEFSQPLNPTHPSYATEVGWTTICRPAHGPLSAQQNCVTPGTSRTPSEPAIPWFAGRVPLPSRTHTAFPLSHPYPSEGPAKLNRIRLGPDCVDAMEPRTGLTMPDAGGTIPSQRTAEGSRQAQAKAPSSRSTCSPALCGTTMAEACQPQRTATVGTP